VNENENAEELEDRSARHRRFVDMNKEVTSHRGHYTEFYDRHVAVCKLSREHDDGFQFVLAQLFYRVTDERSLRLAFDHVAETSGETPGIDGLKTSDFKNLE
jgi:hypothetical protein